MIYKCVIKLPYVFHNEVRYDIFEIIIFLTFDNYNLQMFYEKDKVFKNL